MSEFVTAAYAEKQSDICTEQSGLFAIKNTPVFTPLQWCSVLLRI